MKYEIKIAETEEELYELYQFRYKVYVEEMQRPQKDANHDLKIITDELDVGAANLIAKHENKIVGAARINLADSISDFYMDFYEALLIKDSRINNISIVTRLMIDSEHRNTTLAPRIFIGCYEYGINRGTRFNYVDCNNHLIEFFESFGYRYYIGKKDHYEYGLVNPLILDLHDIDHLMKVKSPFVKSYQKWQDAQKSSIEVAT